MVEIVKLRDGRPSLNDVPGRLRLMADQIEAGEFGEVVGLLALIPRDGDYPTAVGFGCVEGKNEPIVQLELAKAWFVNNLVARSA